ncbi:MAG: hypothetical protein J3R72DRAFT_426032 [Linnemannia gamsii]|nr:MAG: hypothetical protein J3R72DRAFT_426032 [Linnemannia gamsii]
MTTTTGIYNLFLIFFIAPVVTFCSRNAFIAPLICTNSSCFLITPSISIARCSPIAPYISIARGSSIAPSISIVCGSCITPPIPSSASTSFLSPPISSTSGYGAFNNTSLTQ